MQVLKRRPGTSCLFSIDHIRSSTKVFSLWFALVGYGLFNCYEFSLGLGSARFVYPRLLWSTLVYVCDASPDFTHLLFRRVLAGGLLNYCELSFVLCFSRIRHLATLVHCGVLQSILSTVVYVDSFDAVSFTFYSPI